MILVFDVGNSETTIGLFNGEMLRGLADHHQRAAYRR
jgi:hypothetical protein